MTQYRSSPDNGEKLAKYSRFTHHQFSAVKLNAAVRSFAHTKIMMVAITTIEPPVTVSSANTVTRWSGQVSYITSSIFKQKLL